MAVVGLSSYARNPAHFRVSPFLGQYRRFDRNKPLLNNGDYKSS